MENKFDLVEKYLMNEMSIREQAEFEDSLKTDSELMKEYKLRKEINEAIQENDIIDLRNNLDEILNSKEKSRKLIYNPYILSIAALMLLLIVIASLCKFPLKTGNEINSVQSYYQPYPAIMSFRSSIDRNQQDELLYKAFNFYDDKKFEKASEYFALALKNDSASNMAQFYLAICDIENKKLDESVKYLNDLISKNNHIFWEQSHWYLAMVYLQKNDIENAKIMLEKIVKENMSQHSEAKKLLKNLN